MEVRINVVQERFLTFRAQDKYIVLVNLTVEIFFTIGRDFPNEPSKFRFAILLLGLGNYSIEVRTNPYRHLVLERSFRKPTSASMAMNPAHEIDRTSWPDYKKIVARAPAKSAEITMHFPEYRARRLRRTETLRSMVREVQLDPQDFILPFFVRTGKGVKKAVSSMPGHFQVSPDVLLQELKEPVDRGIPAILLFGIPEKKDPTGSEGYARNGIIQRTVREIKNAYPDLIVITDVCLCEYTDHGHCGVIKDRDVDNDLTLELLAKMALSHAQAGADIVAPSDMMDGRVAAIRETLDEGGFEWLPIMAYSAKYASAFYGPFRDAAESPPQFGDRRSYQMDPANSDEAIREVAMDVDEGADLIMVKPALPYLDVIWRVRNSFDLPLAAYNVSGEFAMIKAAAQNGWIDGDRCMMEALTSIKRAGADLIISYHALEAVRILQGESRTSRTK
jgi:porphobilinogen synthase